MDADLRQKEKKLQENKRTIEAQRKAIQELQFENERLSMKLEDKINENKDLTTENNTTRHLCNLLKETCTRSTEKMNKYENESEETRQLSAQNNEHVERMIAAFEELRMQAENTRLEMIFKLKEEMEQRDHLEKSFHSELTKNEQKLLQLKQLHKEKDDEVKQMMAQLQESKILHEQFLQEREQKNEKLEDLHETQQKLLAELQKTEASLHKSEADRQTLEADLEMALKKIIQVTREKETLIEELNQTKAGHASTVCELKDKNSNLEKSLKIEHEGIKELQDCLDKVSSELEKKTIELGEMAVMKNEKERELQGLTKALENEREVQQGLEEQLLNEKIKNETVINELETTITVFNDLKEKIQKLTDEKKYLAKTTEQLQKELVDLKDIVQTKENEINEVQTKLTAALGKEGNSSEKLEKLHIILREEKKKYEDLSLNYNSLLTEKEKKLQEVADATSKIQSLQKNLSANKKSEDEANKVIEKLEEKNKQQRDEIGSLKESMKIQGDKAENQLEEHEENIKNVQNEISKKEKQLKTLETKLSTLKKQVENKNKSIEELQQENKALKKKISAESKQCSAHIDEVNELKLELESVKEQYEENIKNLQDDVDKKKLSEEKLHEEVKRLTIAADDAIKLQKETDIRCQHKIAEMVALMEKHKNQYDKLVKEKDTEIGLFKIKEQEIASTRKSLKLELSSMKTDLLSLEQKLKKTTEEKEKLVKEVKEMKDNMDSLKQQAKKKEKQTKMLVEACDARSSKHGPQPTPKKENLPNTHSFLECNKNTEKKETPSWTPAKSSIAALNLKTYTVKTPPVCENKNPRGKPNTSADEVTKKKRKVALKFDVASDSSEHSDLLSGILEVEVFKNLYKDNAQAAQLCNMTPIKIKNKTNLKSPGSALKHAAVRKMREGGWAAITNTDRKKKMKAAEKFFA
uniref:Synaptonemal complex protein 1 n=1 Tax=Latimeria chalumnae TaxID=7897 RepID=M3XIX7_LATCH|nr:PREDICTED: synaptonemal complex protein 1 [Latimeria chalumnae]|eukprot:XP_014352435.1 PREDICTED: synaptonemal complex protein 1 [Latimeria chalumnae]